MSRWKPRTMREVIESMSIPEPMSGCWLWLGSLNSWGYGRTAYSIRAAHRLSYAASRGDARNMLVLHRCDTPCCVNPDHLFLGTQVDNMRDMADKGRSGTARGECNRSSKLTWSAVNEIRSAQHPNISELARRFGVSRRAIRFALTGETWASSRR